VTQLDRRLSEFVDRSTEMRRFSEILEKRSKPVIFVHGASGVGKSSLLARMIHECSLRGIAKTEIVWTETRNPDHLNIMRTVRDSLGAQHFSGFTALVNGYYDERVKFDLTVNTSGTINVASGASFVNATTGDIAGVMVRDCMFVVPRRDLGVSENERMLRLTQQFLEDLAGFTEGSPTVMFFDAVEKMTEETKKWMWGEFMNVFRDGRASNVVCVFLGQTAPELDRETRRVVEETALGPLQLDDIEEYLRKRNVACQAPRELARMILVQTKGHPYEVAYNVDLFEEMR